MFLHILQPPPNETVLYEKICSLSIDCCAEKNIYINTTDEYDKLVLKKDKLSLFYMPALPVITNNLKPTDKQTYNKLMPKVDELYCVFGLKQDTLPIAKTASQIK